MAGLTSLRDGLVILIDEADKASKDLGLGTFLKNLNEILVQERCNYVLFILSGLPNIRNVLLQSHESSLRLFQEYYLKPLSKEETAQVVKNGLLEVKDRSGVEISITDEAVNTIYSYSEGYPHFVQQIGYSVLEVNTDKNIDKADVDNGFFMKKGALELIGNRYYDKLFYKDINVESQREILTIMTDHWNGWVTRSEIKTNFSGKSTTLNGGIRALIDKGIIIPKEGVKGQYRLQWGSFAWWIKNHKRRERQ